MDLTPAHQLAASRMFLTQEDVDDIIELVEDLALKVGNVFNVLDIGAGSGTTAIAVLQQEIEVQVLTIDIHDEALLWAKANIEGFGISTKNWHGFHGDVQDTLVVFGGIDKFDLILHDGDHSEEIVRKDIKALLPFLYEGAVIWVHDYSPMPGAEETYPGVKIVCDELVEQGYLEPISTTGIGFAARVL